MRQTFDPSRIIRTLVIENNITTETEAKTMEKEIKNNVESEAKDALNDTQLTGSIGIRYFFKN